MTQFWLGSGKGMPEKVKSSLWIVPIDHISYVTCASCKKWVDLETDEGEVYGQSYGDPGSLTYECHACRQLMIETNGVTMCSTFG